MTVVEYTGGSTGSSLAFVCTVKGYPLKIVSSDAFATEKLRTMRALGADVEVLPSLGGQVTPDLIPRMKARAQSIAGAESAYFTNQLYNADIIKGYEQMGHEIVEQIGRPIDAFCAGAGTAGMIMGVTRILRTAYPAARVVILEPAAAALIATGKAGAHGVEGISVGLVPPLLDRQLITEARAIEEEEARAMTRRLAREEGIFAGISSGLNVVGAIQLARELGRGHVVATVACDSGLKYLDGDLYEG
jgi:cysteine synthase